MKALLSNPALAKNQLKPLANELRDSMRRIRFNSPNDLATVTCPVTNIPLYNMDNDNNTFYLASHGTCEMSGIDYHVSALNIPSGIVDSELPIRYYGYTSQIWDSETN